MGDAIRHLEAFAPNLRTGPITGDSPGQPARGIPWQEARWETP